MTQINTPLSFLYLPDFSFVVVLNPLSPSFQIFRNSRSFDTPCEQIFFLLLSGYLSFLHTIQDKQINCLGGIYFRHSIFGTFSRHFSPFILE